MVTGEGEAVVEGKKKISKTAIPKISYQQMAVETVLALGERHGSSLAAIRKYITATYPLKQQQTASFNSLTLKGVQKALALKELDQIKHSFKVSDQEKNRRKEREKKANYVPKQKDLKVGYE